MATTGTAGGAYSFNLTSLGLQIANDMMVRVANGAVQMRAFVTSSNVDLDPASESSVRLVLQQLNAGATLSNFTVQELADITGSINVLATAKQMAAGTSLEHTVTGIQNAVGSNAGLMAFVVAAGEAGQTTQGPGDVGNHISFTQGNQWQLKGTEIKVGIGMTVTSSFTDAEKITGTKLITGVTTKVLSETNPDNSGRAQEEYMVKDAVGITNWGNNDATDVLTLQLVPYPQLRFPLQPGSEFQAFHKQGLDYGQDADGDGKNETAVVTAQVKVVGFENVTVAAGTFSNTIRVESTVNLVVTLSRGGMIPITATQTTWFASGVGPVKQTSVTQWQGQSDTISQELVSYSVDGQGTNVQILSLATRDILYDPFRQVMYASVPASSTSNPSSIAIINPVTGTTISSVPTGTEPGKLALSDDGQFLYVGLDGQGSVARFTASNMTLAQTFSLGTDLGVPLVAGDMQVQPGNPQVAAITRLIPNFSVPSRGVAIYDNGVQRPNTIGGPVDILQFSQSASTLYGFDATTMPSNFLRMSVGSSGVSLIDAFNDLIPSFTKSMVFDAGLLYTPYGLIVNPVTTPPTRTQPFVIPPLDQPRTLLLVRPDSSVGKVFFIATPNVLPLQTRLYSFDQATQQLSGWFDLDAVSGTPNKLIRWGTKGLALTTTGNQVMIIQSPLVSDQKVNARTLNKGVSITARSVT
ncbi:hypothetical protein AYO43_00485 [Nitrospira sp. SCGC AG-212-E16]|nr:hypothetical protein AYO43_00485 [Nitrospira sp. SCGC AG-212-E16]